MGIYKKDQQLGLKTRPNMTQILDPKLIFFPRVLPLENPATGSASLTPLADRSARPRRGAARLVFYKRYGSQGFLATIKLHIPNTI